MKQFNRVISLLLMAVLLVGTLPAIHANAAEDASGTTGNCNWVYTDSTKTLTISAVADTNGASASYSNADSNESFPALRTSVQKVVIEEGVTALGSHLFSYFTALTSVIFPESSLKSLGEGVFRGCTSLTSVTIPDCVESIGRTLFYGCTKLETVVLGGSYTTIPGIVFGACTSLKHVTIPASVSVFELSVSAGNVKRGIFYNAAKTFNLHYCGTREQWNTLVSNLPDGSSDVSLFAGTTVTVECADDGSTSGETGNCTWTYYPVIKTLKVSAKEGTDGTTGSSATADANTIFSSIASSVETVVVEEGVTELGSHLFCQFKALTSVTLPQSSLKALGEGVFRGCTALVSATIPSSVESIGRTLFYGCSKLETVTLGGSYTSIPGIALGSCPSLKEVTIPGSVTTFEVSVSGGGVSRGIFYNGPATMTIRYGGTKEQWKTLLDGLQTASTDVSQLKSSSVTVICSDGTYIYGMDNIVPHELGDTVAVQAASGTVSKYFTAAIEKGKVYKLTVRWNTAPTMTEVKSEWEIESWTGVTADDTKCETLFQSTKRESADANTTTKGFALTFAATKDAAALVLNVQNLSVDNSIVVTLEEASLGEDVVADLTIDFAENTDMGSNLFDLAMKDGQKYIVEAQWSAVPYHTGTANGGTGTAWKFQPVTDEDFWGNNSAYYYSVTATGSDPVAVQQSAVGKFTANSSYTMFNVYAQRVCQANSLHVVVKEDNTPILPFTTPVDYADTEKIFAFPWIPEMQGATSSNYIQGLEIYNDIVFLVYDGGYVRTYDLNTKEFIQEFRLECALESNHAGGATFSKYKYAENDPFPLMYVSCDLSTLGCYVERITYDQDGNFKSEMVQYLDFSGLKGWYTAAPTTDGVDTHNGSLVMIEKNSDTIVYLGRQLKGIGNANNKFVMAHFNLPACVQGNVAGKIYDGGYTIVGESATDTITVDCPVVHFTNDDILDVANAQQDTDGYYYWDYYGRLYQGSCLFREHVMMSHGVSTDYPNAWGDKTFYTGIMNYAYDSDKMSRFLDITGSNGWTGEPQGLVIYEGRMYHIMNHDGLGVYEVKIRLEDLKDSYDLKCYANIDALKAAIEAAVEADLDPDFCVEDIVLPENFALTGEDQTVVAKVSIYTTWNVQTHEISFTLDAHSYTSYSPNGDSTCEADGTKKALCDGGCGAEDTVADSGSKLPHAMTHHNAVGSNCTEDGNVEYWHCGTCDKNFADEAGTTKLDSTVDAKDGHNMTHHEAVPSNCTEDGNVEYWACSACNKNYSDEAGTTELDSTLDPKDGHDLKKVDKVPAEAGKTGCEAHWVCQTCDKRFSDAEGKNEVETSDLVIPALGHEVEKETVTGATIEGLENAIHGESYTFTVKLEEGYVKGENFKVTVNGKELKTNADGSYTIESVTAKLEISITGAVKASSLVPDTGDHSLVTPAVLLAALSMSLAALLITKRKYFF